MPLPTEQMMNLIMSEPKYVNGFRPQFEAGAHARPHLYIGGAMNSFASPDDPIFWLHHTFVDKVSLLQVMSCWNVGGEEGERKGGRSMLPHSWAVM